MGDIVISKNLLIGILAVIVVGVAVVVLSNPWQFMQHGPGGFGDIQTVPTQEQPSNTNQIEQTQQQPSETIPGVGGMGIDQPREEDAFSVSLSLAKTANAGESVEVIASVLSNTAPHARTTLEFYVDGVEIQSADGLIPPYQTASATFEWLAEEGEHKIKAVVSSAAGVTYDEDEKTIVVS